MRSCGAVHDFSAFYKAVEDGQDPQKAWKKLAKQISDKATYGTWQEDSFAAVASEYVVNSCHIHEVRSALSCTQKQTLITPWLLRCACFMYIHPPSYPSSFLHSTLHSLVLIIIILFMLL